MFYVVTPEMKSATAADKQREVYPPAGTEQLCTLSTQKSMDAVQTGTKSVFIRSGVWNAYHVTTKQEAVTAIERSPYGADVYRDTDGNLYVSMPCESDMW